MGEVVAGLAVFGVVIAVGWLLVRSGAVPREADGVLTRVCFFAATPALLVLTISRADLSATLSATTGAAVAAEILAIVSAWLLHRHLLASPSAQSSQQKAASKGLPNTWQVDWQEAGLGVCLGACRNVA